LRVSGKHHSGAGHGLGELEGLARPALPKREDVIYPNPASNACGLADRKQER